MFYLKLIQYCRSIISQWNWKKKMFFVFTFTIPNKLQNQFVMFHNWCWCFDSNCIIFKDSIEGNWHLYICETSSPRSLQEIGIFLPIIQILFSQLLPGYAMVTNDTDFLVAYTTPKVYFLLTWCDGCSLGPVLPHVSPSF